MTKEPTNIKLGEFIQNCVDDLTSGSLTPEEAYIVMRQYTSLRKLVDGKNEEIARKIASGEDFKNILIELLGEIGHLEKQAEPPEEVRPPAEIAARARAFADARQQTEQAIPETLRQRRKDYARKVANAWVAELRSRRLYAKPEEIEKKIFSAVEKTPPNATLQETRATLAQSFQVLVQEDPALAPHQAALGAITQTVELPTVFSIRQETIRAVLDNPETTRPDVLMQLVGQGIDATKAASLTRFSEAFSADINPAIDITRPMKFFQSVTEAGWKKPLAVAADAFLTVLPQETREAVVESVLAKSWGRVTTNLDLLSQQFGAAVVQSELFQNAITRGNEVFAAKRAAGGAAAGISNFFGDALDTVFKEGIDREVMEKYLGLEKQKRIFIGSFATEARAVQHPDWHHFYAGLVHAHDPSIFSFAFDGIRRILGFGGGKIAAGAAGKAIGALTRGGLGKLIGGLLGGIATGPLAPIGAVVGALLGDKILGGLWRGAKSFFNTFLGGGLVTRLFSGGTGRWQDDFPLIITVVVLAPIILLSIFPSFLNAQFVGNTSQESAIASAGVGGTGAGGPTIDCSKTPDIPECKLTQCKGDCRWPLETSSHACISEGPYVGTHSRSHLSAIDLTGSIFGAPVHTPYDGVVTKATFGYPDNSGFTGSKAGGGYGNHVIIQLDKGGTILLGHLRNIQLIQKGQRVAANTVVGYVDHTGYSSGVHLHYEARGVDINSLLPFPVPPCLNQTDCAAKLKASGHSLCL